MNTQQLFRNYFLIVTYMFLSIVSFAQSTTPHVISNDNVIDAKATSSLYYQGNWYIGENTPTGAIIKRLSGNGTIDTIVTVPSFYAPGTVSEFKEYKEKVMIGVNDKLYYYLFMGSDEYAVLMYDLINESSNFSERLSFKQAGLSIDSYNGKVIVTSNSVSSNYLAAPAANWGSPIDTYSGSGGFETSVFEIDGKPSDALRIGRLNYNSALINKGVSPGPTGIVLNYMDGHVVEMDYNGNSIHSKTYTETVKMIHGMNGDYLVKLKNSLQLLDANWDLIRETSRFAYADLNDITIVENRYCTIGGIPNFQFSTLRERQQSVYHFFDQNLFSIFTMGTPIIQRYNVINPDLLNVQTFNITTAGYWLSGYYDYINDIPRYNGNIIDINGTLLPVATIDSPKTLLFHKDFVIPSVQLNIVPTTGSTIYLNKKLDASGNIVSNDQFSAVLLIPDGVDLADLLGLTINNYASYSAPIGWAIDNFQNGTNDSYFKDLTVKYDDGQYFVQIMIYDYGSSVLGASYEDAITVKLNMKIYLRNQSHNSLGLDDYDLESITMYPNPTTDYITISGLDTPKVEIIITSMGGLQVYRNIYDGLRNIEVPLYSLLDGLYIVEATSIQTGGKKSWKIIKN